MWREVNGAAVAQQEYHRRLEQINILSKAWWYRSYRRCMAASKGLGTPGL